MIALLDVAGIEEGAIGAILRSVVLEGEAMVGGLVAGSDHECRKLVPGHFKAADRDRLVDDHLVLRSFVRGRQAVVDLIAARSH